MKTKYISRLLFISNISNIYGGLIMVKGIMDYYAFLNVDRDADKKTIKKAYRKALKDYDSTKAYDSKTKMKYEIINDAYIILSDDEKRAKYDEILNQALKTKKVKKTKKAGTNNIEKTVKFAADMEEDYGLISKLFKMGSTAFKAQPLMTGANIVVGTAVAGYGVKKGRDYMASRRGKRFEEE